MLLVLPETSNFSNINFNGGNLSVDSGILLINTFIKRCGILSIFNKLPFTVFRKFAIHSNHSLLAQVLERKLLGYFTQSSQSILHTDPLLSSTLNIASQPSISRLFNRITRVTTHYFSNEISKQSFRYLNQTNRDLTFDVDSTLMQTHGTQESSAFIHHYATVGYHPLIINEFESKLVVTCALRTGKSYSVNGITEMLTSLISMIKNKHKRTIRLRGDSAFYQNDLLAYLEDYSFIYYVRCKQRTSLTEAVMKDLQQRKIQIEDYSSSKPYYGEIRYKMTNSKESRRVVYKAYRHYDKNGQRV